MACDCAKLFGEIEPRAAKRQCKAEVNLRWSNLQAAEEKAAAAEAILVDDWKIYFSH